MCTNHDEADSEVAELQIFWPAGNLQEPGVVNYLQEAWLSTELQLLHDLKQSGILEVICSPAR